jgi:nucleoid DNA-binding protein
MAKKAAPAAEPEKKAAKKAAPAKAASKGKPATKATPAAPATPAKVRPATKAAVIEGLAAKTGLERKEVGAVLTAMGELIARELGKKGPGMFVLPGLLKIKVVRKPATKAKQGVNPFTKEPMTIKAKPARNVVRAVPLKSLSSSV